MNARKFHPFQLETVVSKRVSKDLKPSSHSSFLFSNDVHISHHQRNGHQHMLRFFCWDKRWI